MTWITGSKMDGTDGWMDGQIDKNINSTGDKYDDKNHLQRLSS